MKLLCLVDECSQECVYKRCLCKKHGEDFKRYGVMNCYTLKDFLISKHIHSKKHTLSEEFNIVEKQMEEFLKAYNKKHNTKYR